MNRKDFYKNLYEKGVTDPNEAKTYESKWIESGRTFDDEQQVQPEAAMNQTQPEPTAYDKYGIAGALFPRTTESTEKGGNFGNRFVAALGDVFTVPQRAIAAGATLSGYNNSGANIPYSEGVKAAAQEFSRFKPTEDTKGITKAAQDIAYDPTLVPGLLAGTTEAKLISKAPGLLKAAIPAVSGALQAGTSSAIQQATEGEIKADPTIKSAAMGAALPTAAAGVTAGAKKVLGDTGKRLIQALIRPGQRGMKEGFDVDYIMNDPEILDAAAGGIESLQKTLQTRFNNLATQVKGIQENVGQETFIDVPKVYFKTLKKLTSSNDFTGMKRELQEALAGLQDNLSNSIEEFDEFTDLATAMKLRTNYGTKVNFQPGISGGGRKAAFGANAEDKVYDTFYKELSNEIKSKAPKEIAEIDKQFTKLIPVLKATNRRVLVETSNLPVGLMESIGGAGVGATSALAGDGDFGERLKRGIAGAAAGAVATNVIKSPRTGAALSNLSKNISIPPAVATVSPANALKNEFDYEELKKTFQRKGGTR